MGSRLPSWLKKPLYGDSGVTQKLLRKHGLNTVCEEAFCPNRQECFHHKRATFLLLGSLCTRSCAFCAVPYSKKPSPVDPLEPEKIAKAVCELGLQSVVLTMVTRDDLSDGGANHVAETVRMLRKTVPGISCELLTSDFDGNLSSIECVLHERPDVFGHNIETVERLSASVRSKATYERSLMFLTAIKQKNPDQVTKSGLMVGFGETKKEVYEALLDLSQANVDIVTIGQYLQPSARQCSVKEWIHPNTFKEYESMAKELKIAKVFSGPFVRSSYTY